VPGVPAGDVQLVALDIDGTILDHGAQLSDRVRDVVRAVADSGRHVVLATGRDIAGTLPVLRLLGLAHGWTVCCNGAVLLRLDASLPEGFAVERATTFDPRPALELLREHLPDALYAMELVDGGFAMTAAFPPGELTEGRSTIVPFEKLTGPTTRVVVRSTERPVDEFLAVIEKAGLQGVSYTVSWTSWLDINPRGVSKAGALEEVRAQLGVDPGRTLAVGDWLNDLPMFAWAGWSVAMGQALPEVRAAADEVTASVAEDGLALVLDRVLAGEPISSGR